MTVSEDPRAERQRLLDQVIELQNEVSGGDAEARALLSIARAALLHDTETIARRHNREIDWGSRRLRGR